MNGNTARPSVEQLVIADSALEMHEAVTAHTREPADLVRMPHILAFLADPTAYQGVGRATLDLIAVIHRLHRFGKITIVAEQGDTSTGMAGHNIFQRLGVDGVGHRFGVLKLQAVYIPRFAPGKDPDECVVTCVDFRAPFTAAREVRRRPNCAEVTIPGAGLHTTQDALGEYLFDWMLTHHITAQLLEHEDCGAYGAEGVPDSAAELQRHVDTARAWTAAAKHYGISFQPPGIIRETGEIVPLL